MEMNFFVENWPAMRWDLSVEDCQDLQAVFHHQASNRLAQSYKLFIILGYSRYYFDCINISPLVYVLAGPLGWNHFGGEGREQFFFLRFAQLQIFRQIENQLIFWNRSIFLTKNLIPSRNLKEHFSGNYVKISDCQHLVRPFKSVPGCRAYIQRLFIPRHLTSISPAFPNLLSLVVWEIRLLCLFQAGWFFAFFFF